ncbi:MAG: FtsW/RodA/SpoVE family cell cycle protein [Kiritimatiellae bacterium]|nr:FtsW/RodA/SpoVE family cell cycle protein [Kiritimatiellia bacterium]
MRKTVMTLVGVVLLMVGLGIVLLASASADKGLTMKTPDPYYFVKQQLVWLVFAFFVAVFFARFNYHNWQRIPWLSITFYVGVVGLLVLVLPYFLGKEVNGSYRWLSFGKISLQPSELGKVMVVVVMSSYLSYLGNRVQRFWQGLVLPGAMLSILLVLLVFEPDYGATMVIGLTGGILMFIAGTRIRYAIPVAILVVAAVGYHMSHNENRMRRIHAWLGKSNVATVDMNRMNYVSAKITKDNRVFSNRDDKFLDPPEYLEGKSFLRTFMKAPKRIAIKKGGLADVIAFELDEDSHLAKLTEMGFQRLADVPSFQLFGTNKTGRCVIYTKMLEDEEVFRLPPFTIFAGFQVEDPAAYQKEQSQIAISKGAFWGAGFLHGLQKKMYLPEPHTDFIFSTGAEEFGYLFSILVVAMFTVILACGLLISWYAPDNLGRFMAFGMTFLLVYQGIFNIGVVTGLFPTKGLALPFFSYGGTNLVVAMFAIGTLVNVGRQIDGYNDKPSPIKNIVNRIPNITVDEKE